jgi:hypothetical protein
VTSGGQEVPTHLLANTVGLVATRWARLTQVLLAKPTVLVTKRRPLRLRKLEAFRPTRNDVSGREL